MKELILPLSIVMSFVPYSMIAKWYLAPRFDKISLFEALIPLVMLHTSRHIGMAFLIPGVTSSPGGFTTTRSVRTVRWASSVPNSFVWRATGPVEKTVAPRSWKTLRVSHSHDGGDNLLTSSLWNRT